MKIPEVPGAVPWRNGMVLEPAHFQQADRRAATLSHLSALVAEPWPWGFTSITVDEVALASRQLRLDCEGVMPNGEPFRRGALAQPLPNGQDGDRLDFYIQSNEDGVAVLSAGGEAPANDALPAARLLFRGGVWGLLADWSPPAYLIGPDHPMRTDMTRQLGALAAMGAGFMATLRLPGAEERPAARMLGQIAAVLAQGVGVIDALLAAPAVSPGRLGIEALRLALGVRGAAGVLEQLDMGWDAADQRGSMRRILYVAESTASGIGLPFRASVFRPNEAGDALVVDGMPHDALLLAIEASQPAALIAARAWLEGAALAAPDRIQEAFRRRVAGCPRHSVERDPRLGVSSSALLALYQVEYDVAWRGGSTSVALAAKTPPPHDTSFSVFIAEGLERGSTPLLPAPRTPSYASASWASGADSTKGTGP